MPNSFGGRARLAHLRWGAMIVSFTTVGACSAHQERVEAPAQAAPNPPASAEPAAAASDAPSAAATDAPEAAASSPSKIPACDLVCQGAKVVPRDVPPDQTADYYTAQAEEKANATLNGMHDDLLRCYTARVKVYPKAHAFLTIDIVVGPDGHVQNVETQGGALLGDPAMKCIVDRIKQGEFTPPTHGGTMRLEVPFTLRRIGPDETI